MKDKTLIGGVLLLAVGAAMSTGGNAQENYFKLPNGNVVPESELKALGYVNYYGRWVLESELIAALQANGMTSLPQENTPNYWALVSTIIQSGLGLTTTIINNIAQQKKQLIDDIIFKYTVAISPNYDGNFPFSKTDLEGKTIKQLKQILAGTYSINGFGQNYFIKTYQSN
ncbi:hypothetical protein [Aureispira sp. CCB-E]|uniref:hypothetical protein n=1 Tax=Aureispira sp. CCB-E TaxID=3051121 RepID=UPI002868E4E8|nr:hypothetical protein [Aureispira sp. CCB-E]WMX12304.1 hypothetical protein QP953_15860 [Aureispira sp. CCB-E]